MNKKLVILAAGLPHIGEDPTLTKQISGLSILDWQLNNFKNSDIDINVVIGFKADEQKTSRYSNICFTENTNWQTTKSGDSLLLTDFDLIDELWISYGDILYHKYAIQKMENESAEAVIAVDSEWKNRYLGRDKNDIIKAEKVVVANSHAQLIGRDFDVDLANSEFVGLVLLKGSALNALKAFKLNKLKANSVLLTEILESIRLSGISIKTIDLKGQWAELNEPKDLAHFVMGTKAETLYRLSDMLMFSKIQNQISFNIAEWQNNSKEIISQIKANIKGDKIVVRSSARSEDAFSHSNAGAYTSLLNVDKVDNEIILSIEKVIKSYHNKQAEDQVLVQPMLLDVIMSGVVFTRTLNNGAPYFVINYDESGSTESITSGTSSKNSLYYFYKYSDIDVIDNPKLKKLVISIKEIEQVLKYDALDIEFAINTKEDVVIFQVRPMTLYSQINDELDNNVQNTIQSAIKSFNVLQSTDFLYGKRAVFGNMPDWNPAEIIGTNPSKLAYSLYKYLILDDVWAQQRAEYGYRDVRPQELLVSFAGKPYIDVRASLNSFISNNVPQDLGNRLVDFYTEWLVNNPHLHDKIEFDVVPTCFGVDFNKWEKRLKNDGGFSSHDIKIIKDGLLDITNNAIGRVESDLQKLSFLEKKHLKFDQDSEINLRKVKSLLFECKLYGTLPFAHLARAGFVAMTFLKEALSIGVISKKAYDDFLFGINTVSQSFSLDAFKVKNGEMDWRHFTQKYGHLRPGTYDITSPAYHESPDKYLLPVVEKSIQKKHDTSDGTWEFEKHKLFDKLRNVGINKSDIEIETFMRTAIEGREKAKFIFSKSLSLVLDILVDWGKKHDLDRQTLSHLSIFLILDFQEKSSLNENEIKFLKECSSINRKEKNISSVCELPPLITSEQDLTSFTLNESHPNYIGSKVIRAEVIKLGNDLAETSLKGKIVMIPQADPGFDWLFGQRIAGLITMYGGANSHMAIRSAEFGIPAAIGIGEKLFNILLQANSIELDPSNSKIIILH